MPLSTAQLQTLKTAINADPTLAAFPLNSDGYFDLANLLNTSTASPDFFIWRSDVSRSNVYNDQDFEGNFWSWATFKAQNATEQTAWIQMFMGDQANFAAANLRAGVVSIFSGSAPQNAQQAHCLSIGRRKAKRIEQMFAVASSAPPTPSGALGSATNVATVVVASVTPQDIQDARNS
jgi:hypothetical protein